jgi:hypothetical protein
MRFLMFYTPAPGAHAGGPPSEAYMEEMNKLIEASKRSGELIETGGLTAIREGARVTQSTGKQAVTDGPFIESTELIGGFALFELPSKEAAVEASKQFLKVAGDGVVTIRPLMEEPPCPVSAQNERAHEEALR